tara:strand:- start:189 stop:545 length:357 start_codon:yes stop_codon:yes gene_type:complete
MSNNISNTYIDQEIGERRYLRAVEVLDTLSHEFFLWKQRPGRKLQLVHIGASYHSDGSKTLCFATAQNSDVYIVKAIDCIKSNEFMEALDNEDKYLAWQWAKSDRKVPDYPDMKLRKC